jgi:hypothetical protein
MGVNRLGAANLASFLVKFACLDCPLHSEVRFVLARVGTAPVRLPGVGFQHRAMALINPYRVCTTTWPVSKSGTGEPRDGPNFAVSLPRYHILIIFITEIRLTSMEVPAHDRTEFVSLRVAAISSVKIFGIPRS